MAEEGNDASDNEVVKEHKGKKRRLLVIMILGGLLVLGAGGGAAYFLSQGGSSSADAETPISSAQLAASETEESSETEEKSRESTSRASSGGSGGRGSEGSVSDLGIDFGDTFKMQPFQLNLGNALENRYVRLEVTLEYSGGQAQKQEIERRMPQLRDAIISIISRKTREFLLAPDGKDALRKEMLIRINRYMKTKVDAVYITDILIE